MSTLDNAPDLSSNRMSPLDALFLQAEDGISHMHIGSCVVFDGPAPTMTELAALVASKLHLVRRLRQTVRFTPGSLGRPVWIDDAHFDVSYHLRHSAVPPPGHRDDVNALMGRLMSIELDRERPLWEMWLIEGLAEGRWALISKVHHCMVDGVSGTDLTAVLMDPSPDAVTAAAEPWKAAAAPSSLVLTIDALGEMTAAPARLAVALIRNARSPRATANSLRERLDGLRSFAQSALRPPRRLSIEGAIGRRRRWSSGQCSLADVQTIRHAFGGSVNDVVLSAITGAFREILIQRGDPVDGVVVSSLVPVSVRTADDHAFNNQVSMMIAELPVGIADPVERLEAVRTHLAALKKSHQPVAAAALIDAANFAPPALIALATRAAMTILRSAPQRTITTVTTNVPGPQIPLYALGREMVAYLPFVPISAGVRIGIAILSYNGRISFGITGDYDSAPDVDDMAVAIEAGVVELCGLAGGVSGRQPAGEGAGAR